MAYTIKEIDNSYVAHTYGRFPVALVRGKGAEAFDETGKRYIDLGTGIGVNAFGYADDVWTATVTAQLGTLQHASNLYYTGPCAELARLICEKTGMKRVCYGNSGAEANECAIKTARRWAFQKYGDESHSTILTLKDSFHGRTVTTLSATGQDCFHTEFGPFTPGFVHAAPDDIEDVRRLAEQYACCAIMIEMVQGEGGIHVLSQAFVDGILAIAKEKDLLVIVDEVQTGNGRTGKLYAYMHYGFTPDIFTTAKGLGGGLPIGACVLGEAVCDVLTPGSHGSTFGGNPVACAGGLSILQRLDDTMMEEIAKKSQYIIDQLSNAPGVKSVSGLGLMLGIECEKPAKEIVMACLEHGLLVLTAKQKVRLLPPLNIPFPVLEEAIDILKAAIVE